MYYMYNQGNPCIPKINTSYAQCRPNVDHVYTNKSHQAKLQTACPMYTLRRACINQVCPMYKMYTQSGPPKANEYPI